MKKATKLIVLMANTILVVILQAGEEMLYTFQKNLAEYQGEYRVVLAENH
jgi:hypothetical protein